MTDPEIRPQDVGAGDARTILDFLNAASAAEIDARIDLPHEPDIGPRLAEHIFDWRTKIGSFNRLEQLLDVPLIGPVRFSQIVRSLVPDAKLGIARDEFDALADEVAALRAALAAAGPGAGARIELRTADPPRYLGQPVRLTATATGFDGEPLDGVPVTLATSWGRLRGADGLSIADGASITLRTAGDGTVSAALVPPTSEDLHDTQQAAIEFELGRLDPDAATPADAADALGTLVDEYHLEPNEDFRKGVDVYFRDFHAHFADRVNDRDELLEWRTLDSVVVAYLQGLRPDGSASQPATTALAVAAAVVSVRDWLAPWLQVHFTAKSAATPLGGELKRAAYMVEPADLMSAINRRAHDYVRFQQGVVGQLVGQMVVQDKLHDFLQSTDVEEMPTEVKVDLFSGVGTSATTIGRLGVDALGAIEQTRLDVGKSVGGMIENATAGLVEQKAFDDAIASKVDKTAFDDALAGKVNIDTLKSLSTAKDFTAFQDSLKTLQIGTIQIAPLLEPHDITGP